MEFDIKIEGLKELDKALAALGAKAGPKVLKSALMYASKPMMDQMKQDVPVLHGGLKKSIGRKGKTDKKGATKSSAIVQVGAVKKKGFRAHFAEFGSSKTRAQPFIRPALGLADEAVARFKKQLAKVIDREAKKQNKP